jgi:hypothetical protein
VYSVKRSLVKRSLLGFRIVGTSIRGETSS